MLGRVPHDVPLKTRGIKGRHRKAEREASYGNRSVTVRLDRLSADACRRRMKNGPPAPGDMWAADRCVLAWTPYSRRQTYRKLRNYVSHALASDVDP